MLSEVEKIGFTFDYGLCGTPYDLRKKADLDTVKCCNCDFKGIEDELISCKDNDGFLSACPNCETDAYLADVTEEAYNLILTKHY